MSRDMRPQTMGKLSWDEMEPLSFLAVVGLAAPAGSLHAPSEPVSVADGIDAEVCQFPSAVMLSNGCSGSLIAPTIVLTASHCLDPELTSPVVAVSFGEGNGAEAFSVPTVRCESHPDYEIIDGAPPQALNDVGFCELAEPVDDIPPIPVIYGCEVEALEVGAPLTIVGFGGSSGSNNDPGNPPQGLGVKRLGPQVLQMLDDTVNDLWLLAPRGSQTGACFGDSGGPALIELADGTWRVVAVGSSTHPINPGVCGGGGIYDLVHPVMPWLEQETGVDLTPCHDVDGTWNPTEACGDFPTSPETVGNTWRDACGPHALSDLGQSCGPPAGAGETGDTDGDTGAETDTGDPGTTGGPAPGDSTSGGPDGSADGDAQTTSVMDPQASTGSAAADGDDGGSGCACTTAPQQSAPWLLVLWALVRRRSADRS